MISGINHITIAVRNLEESFSFYKDILGFQPLMRHSKGAYFLAGNFWVCLDLDPTTRKEPLPEYTHFAFSIDEKDFNSMNERLLKADVKKWKENVSEGDSLYFLDPNGHKLEIHVGDWKSRIESIKKNPWNDSIELFDLPQEPKINLRPAKTSETDLLSALTMRSKSYWPYSADYLTKSIALLKILESDIADWPVRVAELNNEVVGFFALKTIKDENRLDHLWIDPRYIGKGIGKILFLDAQNAAKNIGWKSFRLVAEPHAELFYLKMGAKNIGSVQSRVKPDFFLPHMEVQF